MCVAIRKQIKKENCINLLLHDELMYQHQLCKDVAGFVAKHFLDLVSHSAVRNQIFQVPRPHMFEILYGVAGECKADSDAETVVRFAQDWADINTVCDLLRDCKQWQWPNDSKTSVFLTPKEDQDIVKLRSPPNQSYRDASAPRHSEWKIADLKKSLKEPLPMRYVCGHYFDWFVRLDYATEGRLRIVYEAAVRNDLTNAQCLARFPAAMFAWQVYFRGANVFHERPVFICFPYGVSLHWSTTLPLQTADLKDDDELTMNVHVMENPLVSLILYYFSTDLNNTVENEDILNRLPHIEYRCLSSYTLFQSVEQKKITEQSTQQENIRRNH